MEELFLVIIPMASQWLITKTRKMRAGKGRDY